MCVYRKNKTSMCVCVCRKNKIIENKKKGRQGIRTDKKEIKRVSQENEKLDEIKPTKLIPRKFKATSFLNSRQLLFYNE